MGFLGSGDRGTNILFVGECVRVFMLIGCMSRSGVYVVSHARR